MTNRMQFVNDFEVSDMPNTTPAHTERLEQMDLTPSWETALRMYGEIIANGSVDGARDALEALASEGRKIDVIVRRIDTTSQPCHNG